jgi:hypothetical protein
MSPVPEAISAVAAEVAQTKDDERLTRLLDYTKFHIGIYISAGGGLVALLASAAQAQNLGSTLEFLKGFVAQPWALALACLLMVIAGAAGGIIASCCTQYRTFEELWSKPQGPHTCPIFTGKTWAFIEHGSFWLSFALASYSVLWSKHLWSWIIC